MLPRAGGALCAQGKPQPYSGSWSCQDKSRVRAPGEQQAGFPVWVPQAGVPPHLALTPLWFTEPPVSLTHQIQYKVYPHPAPTDTLPGAHQAQASAGPLLTSATPGSPLQAILYPCPPCLLSSFPSSNGSPSVLECSPGGAASSAWMDTFVFSVLCVALYSFFHPHPCPHWAPVLVSTVARPGPA